MRTLRNIMIAALSFLATSVVVIAAHAQATNTLLLTLTPKSFAVSADDQARVNLLQEIQRMNPALVASGKLEIQMLRVTAKTGVGGAQFFLRVNNDFVDSQSLETDPDQLTTADITSARRVTLKNIERARLTEASLVIQGFSNAKILSVEVVIGGVIEVAVLGHYASEQVTPAAGATAAPDVVVKPSEQAVKDIYNHYYAPPPSTASVANPSVVDQMVQTLQSVKAPETAASSAPAAAPAEPPQPRRACANNRRGDHICVGDQVKNRWGLVGSVQNLQMQNGQAVALVQFGTDDPANWRDVDSIAK